MKTAVVIPTRNNVGTIEKCLASLVSFYQQGHVSEIVVVDAHSTDGTLDVVRRFPVRLLHDEGHGEYVAREMGWRETNSELVLFIDNDAYVGEGFFPDIWEWFKDSCVGIVGAYEQAVTTSQVSRTIGEWWLYHGARLKRLVEDVPDSWSWFQRLYHRIAWNGEKQVTTSGPCYIVRRSCLEAVDGFGRPLSADIFLSRRIIEKGWKAVWWLDAPLFHHPPSSLKELLSQRRHWGKADAIMQRGSLDPMRKAFLVSARLGTPAVGLLMAVRFRNPRHIWLFPLAQYAWIYGYITTAMTFKRTTTASPNP